jgi:hypothetical protein
VSAITSRSWSWLKRIMYAAKPMCTTVASMEQFLLPEDMGGGVTSLPRLNSPTGNLMLTLHPAISMTECRQN